MPLVGYMTHIIYVQCTLSTFMSAWIESFYIKVHSSFSCLSICMFLNYCMFSTECCQELRASLTKNAPKLCGKQTRSRISLVCIAKRQEGFAPTNAAAGDWIRMYTRASCRDGYLRKFVLWYRSRGRILPMLLGSYNAPRTGYLPKDATGRKLNILWLNCTN